ncbi:hypothetical protein [Pedobacter cryoconitis]|uniref:Uncharacterized protein n=1 Tax=Pedobacter cryoconitis TaxID=188932 RepID=A0A327S883_9SPHI|nr:hypothetical protein [Pedobacter cryoconitis]RAJ24552.1 hypothetical protein LY11_04413 [Pedobacter cryoconitis]
MTKLLKTIFAIVSIAIISSCSTTKKTTMNTRLQSFKYNYCAPNIPYLQHEILWKDSVKVDLSRTGISSHDQFLCQILGISSTINDLWAMKQHTKESVSAQVLLRQKVTSRILLAQTQLQAVAAELDCEGSVLIWLRLIWMVLTVKEIPG